MHVILDGGGVAIYVTSVAVGYVPPTASALASLGVEEPVPRIQPMCITPEHAHLNAWSQ